MRSSTQKLLHPLCGRPIIEWPVAAARAAGAAKIVVVDSPERRLEAALNGADDVELAVQERPLGTADAVRAAVPAIAGAETVVVLNGDVPLITAATLHGLVEDHARTGSAGTIATIVLDDPRGYGRVVRAPDGTVDRVVETKAPGDASELELHIREVNTGLFAFEAAALNAALAAGRDRQRAGRAVPPRRAADPA